MPSIFEERTKNPNGSIFKQRAAKDEESFGKNALRTTYQPIGGFLQKFTYPADIVQMMGVGEALDPEFLENLKAIHEREGIPFDENKYRQKVSEAAQAFPTQGNIEKLVEEKTGLPLQAKEGYQKALRLGGTAGGFQPGSLVQKGTAAVTAPAVSELAQLLGLPEGLSEILGLTSAGGAASGKIVERALTPEQQALRQIAGKHNLPTHAGMEVEGQTKVTPVLSKGKTEKLRSELNEASEKAIDDIISRQLPTNEAEKLGVSPEAVYERSYKRMEETAKQIDKKAREAGRESSIDVAPVLNWIKNEISRLEKTAPSLSTPDKVRIKILKDEYKALSEKPTPLPPEAVRLVDIHGKPLEKIKKGRQPKNVTAEQAVDQTRNYNENVRDLYRKAEFTGAQQEVRETYAQLNDQIQKAMKTSGETDLARQLWFGNQVFHETAKVNQVNNIISPAFENGYNVNKLSSILKQKGNRKFLERNLGKDAVKEMIDIAHYGKEAEAKVFSRLKNPKTVGEIVSDLTPLKAGLLFLKHGATAGLGTAFEIGKGAGQRVAGMLFTRPGTRKAYRGFLKGAASSKKGAFAEASANLSKAIQEEFGSEENLMKLINEEEN
jgi:hypothetical protein